MTEIEWVTIPREPTDAMESILYEAMRDGRRLETEAVFRDMIAAAPAPPSPVVGEPVPTGAIVNGSIFADRVEQCDFECVAGPLQNNSDWQEFRRCFNFLADWAQSQPTSPASLAAVTAERDAAVEQAERLERQIAAARLWYWPEDDTSSDACCNSPHEIFIEANPGAIVAISSGGVIETRYYAWLPPAADSDSDDEFEVDEATEAEAIIKLGAELSRRAALTARAAT